MRRLLILFLFCGAFAAGCGSTDEPAEPIPPAVSDTDESDTGTVSTDSRSTDSGGADSVDDGDLEPEDDTNTDLVVQAVAMAWGIDEELARCVVEELSLDDPAAIDPAAVDDPTQEICGTSLVELMTGASR